MQRNTNISSASFEQTSFTVSPLTLRQVYCDPNTMSENCVSPLMNGLTPRNGKASVQQWMTMRREQMRREEEQAAVASSDTGGGGNSNSGVFARQSPPLAGSVASVISANERAKVAKAVYGLLRDNLPPGSRNDPEELCLIAESIETKLHDTAASPRSYSSLSTLEFRIKALATAVLIHADRGHYERHNGVSDTCVRLSAVTRKNLAYCIVVLMSFEKHNLEARMATNRKMKMMQQRQQKQMKQQQMMMMQQQQQQQQRNFSQQEARSSTDNNSGNGMSEQMMYYQMARRRAEQLVEYERMAKLSAMEKIGSAASAVSRDDLDDEPRLGR